VVPFGSDSGSEDFLVTTTEPPRSGAGRVLGHYGVGKETFYRQIDRSLQAAYDVASETMSRNALLEDAAARMDAFLQKRPRTWRGHSSHHQERSNPTRRPLRLPPGSAFSAEFSAFSSSSQRSLSAGRAEHSPRYGS
jgi:hypothetical protein